MIKKYLYTYYTLLLFTTAVYAVPPWYVVTDGSSNTTAYLYGKLQLTRLGYNIVLADGTTVQLSNYAIRSDVATSTATLTTNFNNLGSSWTYTNNGLNAITGKTSGGVQSYLAEVSSDAVKWYITVSTQGRVWIQNFLP